MTPEVPNHRSPAAPHVASDNWILESSQLIDNLLSTATIGLQGWVCDCVAAEAPSQAGEMGVEAGYISTTQEHREIEELAQPFRTHES